MKRHRQIQSTPTYFDRQHIVIQLSMDTHMLRYDRNRKIYRIETETKALMINVSIHFAGFSIRKAEFIQ